MHGFILINGDLIKPWRISPNKEMSVDNLSAI
jgi:hypothetical protein